MVKNPPAVQETHVRSLGQEDPLEKGMATHSSILAWRIPWMEEPGGLEPMESQRVGHDRTTRGCCHFLLQGMVSTHGSNPDLHYRQILYHQHHLGIPGV